MELNSKVQVSENIIREKKVSEYGIDETAVINVGPDYVWIRVATIEAENKEILGMSISKN